MIIRTINSLCIKPFKIKVNYNFILYYRPGPMLRKVLDSNSYQGVNLSHSDTSQMMTNKDKLLDKLSESMDNRFSDVGSGILSNMKIVSFQQWPDPENNEVSIFNLKN